MARHWTPLFTVLLLTLSSLSSLLLGADAQLEGSASGAVLLRFKSDVDSPSEITNNCSCPDQTNTDIATNQNNCTSSTLGAPEIYEPRFREIVTLPRHAELTLTWDKPANESTLCFYEIRIRGTAELGCQVTDDVIIWVDKDYTNLTLTTASFSEANLSLPLLYECPYRLTMSTYPRGSEEIVREFPIRHSLPSNDIVSLDCSATYKPESVTYDLAANWSLVPYDRLISEAVDISGYVVSLLLFPMFQEEGTIHGNSHIFEDKSVLQFSFYAVELKFECLPGKFGDPLFWRRPLVGRPCGNVGRPYTCQFNVPPHPPTPLQVVELLEADYFLLEGTLRVSLSWEPPIYPNGELRNYELRIGSRPISSDEDMPETGTIFKQTEVAVTRNNFSYDVRIEGDMSNEVYVQMRSKNNFVLNSEWSDAIVIDLLNVTVESNTTFEPPDVTERVQLPPYVFAVIAVAIVILLAILIVLACSCIAYVRKHFFISIDSEVVPVRKSFHGPILKDRNNFVLINYAHNQVDEWEIAEDEITVFKDQPLGEGCFGQVFKGLLIGQSLQNRPKGNFRPPIFSLTCTVAVKQLKKDAHGSDRENFFKEMKMMKMVSSSDNEMKQFVVNMVGCITVKEPLLLVVEYVRHGDLQRFLRTIKRQVMTKLAKEQSEATPYLEPEGAYSELNPSTERYAELGSLEEKNLLEFARQIAAGMEFLSGLGVIHRDLACRNILIGEHKKLKISDFGMSRYLPKDEVYVPMSHGLLPLRWMATESIHAREFTTASDVWSYGVVLWELCTMCDFPYKSIPNHELLGYLRRGYRLPKPSTCSPEVYAIMLRCWSEQQLQRPNFFDLRKEFDQFLSVYVQDHYPYIELESGNHYDRIVSETDPMSYGLAHLFGASLNGSDSIHNLETAEQLDDPHHGGGSMEFGSNLSPPNEGAVVLTSNAGRATHLNLFSQQNVNRLSVLSDSTPLVRSSTSNQDLRSMSSSVNQLDLIGRQGIQSLPTHNGLRGSFQSLRESEFVDMRYVESPTTALSHSSVLVSSDLSINGTVPTNEGIGRLDKEVAKMRTNGGSQPERASQEKVNDGEE